MNLTPVEKYDGIYFKRDDLFCPYGDVNGGKVRQTIELIKKHKPKGVISAVSVHSPTGPVISRVAKEFGIPCIIAVGGTKEENLNKLPMMKLTKEWGGDIRIVAGHGMKNVVSSRMKSIQKEVGYFDMDFSHHIFHDSDLMFDTNSYQVQNIPDELDVLVMSLGVGIQFSCVLKGLKKYNKKVKRIIGVQVGPDRRKLIDSYLNQNPLFEEPLGIEYELYQDKSAYSKSVEYNIDGLILDDIYEGKAYKWLLENIDLKQKILLWCIGRRLKNGMESI